jgi:hypothetical protein
VNSVPPAVGVETLSAAFVKFASAKAESSGAILASSRRSTS